MLYFSTFARCLDHEGILNIVTWMRLSLFCDVTTQVKIISGHGSDAIHCYKRPSFEQEMSVSKALYVPDFASAGGYSDVKRHCTNAENRAMSHKDKHNSKVTLDSSQPSLSSGVMRIVLPENVDTVVISKNGREITVIIACWLFFVRLLSIK